VRSLHLGSLRLRVKIAVPHVRHVTHCIARGTTVLESSILEEVPHVRRVPFMDYFDDRMGDGTWKRTLSRQFIHFGEWKEAPHTPLNPFKLQSVFRSWTKRRKTPS